MPSVLVMLRSWLGVSASVSVAELFEPRGSISAGPDATLAVLTSDPVADGATVPVNVYVADPPAASVTVDTIEPLPEAAPHDEPIVAAHVHVAFVNAALKVSVTGASIAVDGPALLTTIV